MTGCLAPRCSRPRTLGAVFCDEHITAPSGTRGGWISAEKRRRSLASSSESPLDASNITRRLWVGGKPPFDRDLPFDLLVLCAQELQPEHVALQPPKFVLRVPLPDSTLTRHELRRALLGGQAVARALTQGQRVLVTCYAGLNRSALVASLGIGLVTRMKPDEIIELMRSRRSELALSNEHFVDVIRRFVGRR